MSKGDWRRPSRIEPEEYAKKHRLAFGDRTCPECLEAVEALYGGLCPDCRDALAEKLQGPTKETTHDG